MISKMEVKMFLNDNEEKYSNRVFYGFLSLFTVLAGALVYGMN